MDGPATEELGRAAERPAGRPAAPTDGVGRRHLGWLAVLALAVLVLFAIDGPAQHALRSAGWVDRDERFTELYFPDHLALPDQVTGGEPLAFQFSVRNREGATRTYDWQVLIGLPEAPGSIGAIASGELRLVDDEVRIVDVDVDPAADLPGGGDVVVTVVLVGRPEAIHFPVVVEPPGAALAATSP